MARSDELSTEAVEEFTKENAVRKERILKGKYKEALQHQAELDRVNKEIAAYEPIVDGEA